MFLPSRPSTSHYSLFPTASGWQGHLGLLQLLSLQQRCLKKVFGCVLSPWCPFSSTFPLLPYTCDKAILREFGLILLILLTQIVRLNQFWSFPTVSRSIRSSVLQRMKWMYRPQAAEERRACLQTLRVIRHGEVVRVGSLKPGSESHSTWMA